MKTNNEKKYYDEDTLTSIENCTKTSKNIIKIINVLNLVRNFIIMASMNVLKIAQELHLNMNQQQTIHAIKIVQNFHLFFILIKIKKMFCNCSNYFLKKEERW